MKTVAIIVAGGSGARFGSKMPKQFLKIADRPLLAHTIERFEDTPEIDEIYVVVPESFIEFTRDEIIEANCFGRVTRVIAGGASRAESTRNALAEIPDDFDLIAVHDGARPLVAPSDITRVINAAKESKAAVLVTEVADTIKRSKDNAIIETVDRQELFAASTPQVFERETLLKAHQSAASDTSATDDSFLVESIGVKPQIVIAERPNPKVTTSIDLELVKILLQNKQRQSERNS